MNIDLIKNSKTTYIGKQIEYFKQIDSTHKYVLREIKNKNWNNVTIVIANKQTNAIGTKGRTWYTQEGNISMSIILFPNCEIQQLQGLTINVAIAIKKAIKELYGYELIIKEPNDLLCNGKKICGILIQSSTSDKKVNYIVISIGMNINTTEFTNEIENIATSLKREYNKEYSCEEIIKGIIEEIEKLIYFANI